MVGGLVLCLQERRDQSIYYDAHVLEIERKTHDIRGCRCLFFIRYDHDSSEASIETVRLRRLCRILG
ncbi:protein SAWADEE HOMEODOMAIN-like protein 2-like isoform X6 [Gossypium australe]|nr:protein SAWADEE HOMEODOMAIN-like protein 2-like isoform X6 [Gossypium australe]